MVPNTSIYAIYSFKNKNTLRIQHLYLITVNMILLYKVILQKDNTLSNPDIAVMSKGHAGKISLPNSSVSLPSDGTDKNILIFEAFRCA